MIPPGLMGERGSGPLELSAECNSYLTGCWMWAAASTLTERERPGGLRVKTLSPVSGVSVY